MSELKERLGSRIREYRNIRKMTQYELSVAVGLSRAMVASWETGRASVEVTHLVRLCKVLEASPNTLLKDEIQAVSFNELNIFKRMIEEAIKEINDTAKHQEIKLNKLLKRTELSL